ncbi:hypothetical protein [Massilia sp. TWR1-2-2]|uniref:hypothetical protein n=1 Tax=Massilia sp. TWR1-2-2 TaxID=2804584 RepID=UPI003CEE783C
MPLSFGDLVTAWKSTGIPNIACSTSCRKVSPPRLKVRRWKNALPTAPALWRKQLALMALWRARINTVNGYSYTPLVAVEALRLVVAGQFKFGFQTPATAFVAGFALSIPDTRIIDMV